MKVNFVKFKRYIDFEHDINRSVLIRLKDDRKFLLDKIKELKGVLRTPVLYTMYRNRIEELAFKMERGIQIEEDKFDPTVDEHVQIFGDYSNNQLIKKFDKISPRPIFSQAYEPHQISQMEQETSDHKEEVVTLLSNLKEMDLRVKQPLNRVQTAIPPKSKQVSTEHVSQLGSSRSSIRNMPKFDNSIV